MESAPPSYENATLVDYWDIIARYMPSRDLTSAAVVCSNWHSTFAPHIWGNPASHFGIENDRVYVALTRFSRNLQTARLIVRRLTHTLHMPPAHAEIYNGPHTDWLRDILERLPNLQSLVVRGLPFFDHGALQALAVMQKQAPNDSSPSPGIFELPASTGSLYQSPSSTTPSFGLRLLDASRCPNVTSSGLASALGRFEGLLYLDLSFTYPARSPTVLATLSRLAGLQVLKLRGISLRDEAIETLCKSIGRRVRSLDVRDNEITDRSVRGLLDHCFAYSTRGGTYVDVPSRQRSPLLLPYLGSDMLEVYQGEDFEGYLRNTFTGRFVSRLAIEDTPITGVTHLYIAGNALTVEGISGLVRSGNLHVLDAGTVVQRATEAPSPTSRDASPYPGCEKLTPILAKHASESMTFLRIDHSIITKTISASNEVVSGRSELGDTSYPDLPRHAAELGSIYVRPESHEMAVDETTPRYELPGDPMQHVVFPVVGDNFNLPDLVEPPDDTRRGSAFAPETVDEIDDIARRMRQGSILSPTSAQEFLADTSCSTLNPTCPRQDTLPMPNSRPRSYSSMALDRKARLAAHRFSGHSFHPAMLPHVSTLVLTSVPPVSPNSDLANRIICFIKQCAEEASLAILEAKLDYALPPGRRGHTVAVKQSAKKLFALKRLVLELAPASASGKLSSPWQHPDTKSLTGDWDSEKLWSAAETDFSFFGDEECVFPTLDNGRSSFVSGVNDKEVSFEQPSLNLAHVPSREQMVDNVAVISNFRKERKLAHQRSLATGQMEHDTEGLWDGVVQVVRHNKALRSDEEMDYYGNLFTNNYLYR